MVIHLQNTPLWEKYNAQLNSTELFYDSTTALTQVASVYLNVNLILIWYKSCQTIKTLFAITPVPDYPLHTFLASVDLIGSGYKKAKR